MEPVPTAVAAGVGLDDAVVPQFPSGRLRAVELIRVSAPLIEAIGSAHGIEHERWSILVRAEGADGVVGWGECPALAAPTYTSEWHEGAWAVLLNHLAPAAVAGRSAAVRGHPMAVSAMEGALVDLELRRRGASLAEVIGATRERVEVTAVVGMMPIDATLARVSERIDAGYRSIKLKVQPGHDVELLAAVRERWPDIALSVDANASYADVSVSSVEALDSFGLAYIEQPLGADDLVGHARLVERLQTTVALDESVTSLGTIESALALGAVGAASIKPSRMGGLVAAVDAHALLVEHGIPLWCGGMFELGIGRAAALAVAALPGCVLASDVAPTSTYLGADVVAPYAIDEQAMVPVPRGPGLGVEPDPERLDQLVVARRTVAA